MMRNLVMTAASLSAMSQMLNARRFDDPMRRARRADRSGGKVKIAYDSSLRKLMRAANRGRVPHDRLGIIIRAQESAAIRAPLYMHGKARKAAEAQGVTRLPDTLLPAAVDTRDGSTVLAPVLTVGPHEVKVAHLGNTQVFPASPDSALALADAQARQRGENLDGSKRRETVLQDDTIEPSLVPADPAPADTIAKCKNADRYKAMRAPACNGGNPCLSCRAKWEAKR